jgi:hypothetical protein
MTLHISKNISGKETRDGYVALENIRDDTPFLAETKPGGFSVVHDIAID